MKARLHRVIPAAVTIFGLVAFWQAATAIWAIPGWLLPAPSNIALAMWQSRTELLYDVGVTVSETLIGFAVALAAGLPIAAVLVSSDLLWRAFYPVLAGIQSIPKNAVAPLLIVWFGTGALPKVVIAFLISFFPILINAISGMRLVDTDAMDMVKSLRASKLEVFWYLRLPNALPYIFAASKVAITLALVGAVIGEFIGANSGLGYLILISSSQLQTDVAFVAIVLLALIGMVLFALVAALERLMMPWAAADTEQLTADVA